jgi:SPP1 gp7 family putative phage head morphogenesis protein
MSNYWQRREEEHLAKMLKDEKRYEREIQRIYKDMLDSAQKEINAFYSRYAEVEGITLATAKRRVSKLDIEAYERKAEKYVKNKTFTKKANEEMRLYNLTMKVNRLEMLKANIGLEMLKGHAELDDFMQKILKDRTMEELERQAGILGKTIKNNAKLADEIVNGSWQNATFSERIWGYQSQLRADLGKALEQGLIAGKNARTLTKDVEKYFIGNPNQVGGAQFNAERLMRTELARVQTAAQKASFEKNGFKQYRFIVNSGCCDLCKEIAKKKNGVFNVADMMPGENAPPLHPFAVAPLLPMRIQPNMKIG